MTKRVSWTNTAMIPNPIAMFHKGILRNGARHAFGIYTDDVFSRLLLRNNLFIGGPGGEYDEWSSGRGDVVSLRSADATVDMDYDEHEKARISGCSSAINICRGMTFDIDVDWCGIGNEKFHIGRWN